MALDEYGVPVQVGQRLQQVMKPDGNLDTAIEQFLRRTRWAVVQAGGRALDLARESFRTSGDDEIQPPALQHEHLRRLDPDLNRQIGGGGLHVHLDEIAARDVEQLIEVPLSAEVPDNVQPLDDLGIYDSSGCARIPDSFR